MMFSFTSSSPSFFSSFPPLGDAHISERVRWWGREQSIREQMFFSRDAHLTTGFSVR